MNRLNIIGAMKCGMILNDQLKKQVNLKDDMQGMKVSTTLYVRYQDAEWVRQLNWGHEVINGN